MGHGNGQIAVEIKGGMGSETAYCIVLEARPAMYRTIFRWEDGKDGKETQGMWVLALSGFSLLPILPPFQGRWGGNRRPPLAFSLNAGIP
jgi:hypothetical protein